MLWGYLAVAILPQTAKAAELVPSNLLGCDYEFRGEIQSGDASMLREIGHFYDPVVVCLEGEGGNLREGLRVFDAIWDGNINTKVLSGKVCSSACAIAFLAGGDTQGTNVTRQIARGIQPGATLRFHSPRLIPLGGAIQSDLFRIPAYETAIQTAAELFALSRRSERGVRTITDFVLWRILDTAYEEWYSIETVGDAVLAGLDILIPLDVQIVSDAQIINICDNLHASKPWRDIPISMKSSAAEYYDQVAGQKYREDAIKWPRVLQKKVEKLGRASTLLIHGATYYSGSKYGEVYCIVEIDPLVPGVEPNSYGDPAYTEHRETRVRAGLGFFDAFDGFPASEVQLNDVPIWFTFSPDQRIAEIE